LGAVAPSPADCSVAAVPQTRDAHVRLASRASSPGRAPQSDPCREDTVGNHRTRIASER
jgi:hypothetical protein